jgi:hypothetical protein
MGLKPVERLADCVEATCVLPRQNKSDARDVIASGWRLGRVVRVGLVDVCW